MPKPLNERDDVWSLPIPAAAKRYARRKGLASMMRQPKEFQRVNAMLMNPGKPDKWRNYDAGELASGGAVGKRKMLTRKESAARIVAQLLED